MVSMSDKSLPLSKRLHLINADPDSLIRIYTFQHPKALEIAKVRGYLSGNHGSAIEGFEDAYLWMRDQMQLRLSDFSGDFPIWAWPKRLSARSYNPQIDEVRITALVPRKRLLLSDFNGFHYVLNNQELTLSEADFDAITAGEKLSDQASKIRSWQQIFDLSDYNTPLRKWNGNPDKVQICADRIFLCEIVSLRYFPART
jgi:hypothetical protein